MGLAELVSKSAPLTGGDEDITMGDALLSASISSFKEEFSFDWSNATSDTNSSLKGPAVSPVSPTTYSRMLQVGTASLTSYFLDASPSTSSTSHNSPTSKPVRVVATGSKPSQIVLPLPPPKPLDWVWQCHLCRSRYPLSVTRRCLIDGHYYCSGNTLNTQRNTKRRRKPQSCTSEFDYVGWQDWGQWRRKCLALRALANGRAAPKLHGCEGCSFPSQCRYEQRPSLETLKFETYVEENEIWAAKKLKIDENASSWTNDVEEQLQTDNEGKDTGLTEVSARNGAIKLSKIGLSSEKTLQKTSNGIRTTQDGLASKRQRFYSGLIRNQSSTDLSPTKEAAYLFEQEKGGYDTSLSPAGHVTIYGKPDLTTTPIDPLLTAERTGVARASSNDLDAIQPTLKATLAGQRSKSGFSRSTFASTPQRQSSSSSTLDSKRRVNSKTGNPTSEATTSDVADDSTQPSPNDNSLMSHSHENRSSVPITPPGLSLSLQRTDSRQDLLTDWFKQGRAGASDKSGSEKPRRAASAIDIAGFLQRSRGRTTSSSASVGANRQHRHDNTKGGAAEHFEEINLSPVAQNAPFSERFPPATNSTVNAGVDPVKKTVVSAKAAGSGEVEKGRGRFRLSTTG